MTKKRRGGSRRMYWERISVPVSAGVREHVWEEEGEERGCQMREQCS